MMLHVSRDCDGRAYVVLDSYRQARAFSKVLEYYSSFLYKMMASFQKYISRYNYNLSRPYV